MKKNVGIILIAITLVLVGYILVSSIDKDKMICTSDGGIMKVIYEDVDIEELALWFNERTGGVCTIGGEKIELEDDSNKVDLSLRLACANVDNNGNYETVDISEGKDGYIKCESHICVGTFDEVSYEMRCRK